ncbi:MAG: tetratricopeptide repeat protein [Calditrichaeota bacterium]|nr:tetratricopeptide repeat protein [Calditrichota bacterium]
MTDMRKPNADKRFSFAVLRLGWTAVFLAAVFVVLLAPAALLAQSADVQHLFEQGNSFYRDGQYEKAIEAYEKVRQLGYESPELYYNLGNAYFRTGQIGKAVLNLERARRLAPKDEDIRHNLQIVNLRVVDKVPHPPKLFFQVWYEAVRNLLSVDGWTLLFVVLYVLAASLVVVWVLARRPVIRTLARRALAFVLVLLLGTGLFWIGALRASRVVHAVVTVPRVEVLSAPEEGATEVFPLHEGVVVQIRDRSDGWYEIRLPDGKVGWLKKEAVEIV